MDIGEAAVTGVVATMDAVITAAADTTEVVAIMVAAALSDAGLDLAGAEASPAAGSMAVTASMVEADSTEAAGSTVMVVSMAAVDFTVEAVATEVGTDNSRRFWN